LNPNDLLLWLSSKKCGTWARYRSAVDELRTSDQLNDKHEDVKEDILDTGSIPIYQRLRLNLERLGHAEFFRKGFKNGWRVVPPILISENIKEQVVGILCGARTEEIITKLKREANNNLLITNQHECPDRIAIYAKSINQLEELAISTGINYQAKTTQLLLASMPPVDDWQLRSSAEIPFGKDWEVYQFSVDSLGWSLSDVDKVKSSSFGLFRFMINHQYQYYIKLRGRSFKIPVQVGKYIVLRSKRKNIVIYDDVKQIFLVPISCRPPLLIDRALTLCSGLLPSIESGHLIYSQINHKTALSTVNLLRQRMR